MGQGHMIGRGFRFASAALCGAFALFMLIGAAQAQTPGSYRVGQSVNANNLIVCTDDMDAEDIVDGFKTSDADAAKEFALSERVKDGSESACKRLNNEQVRIVGMPVTNATRAADQQKAAVVKVETASGRSYYAVLFGDYRFEAAPVAVAPAAPPPPPAAAAPRPAPQVSLADTIPGRYSVSGTNPGGGSYSGEVTIRHDRGTYYFVWHVGSDTFRGSGKLSGRTLTINWGQSSPVIYHVGNDGVLRGRWARGAGTEDLEKM
jgi:hypothetical protein